jgi:hypothetical protein
MVDRWVVAFVVTAGIILLLQMNAELSFQEVLNR